MKDLDFDELDRAVNSLMSGVPKSKPQAADASEKVLELDMPSSDAKPVTASAPIASPSVPPTPSMPTTPDTSQAPQKAAEPASVRPLSAAPAARRGGRFMDVVHPSMDMKKTESSSPVSRSGVTIEPRPQANAAAKPPTKPDVTSATASVEKSEDEPIASMAAKPEVMPDSETSDKKATPEVTSEPERTSSSDWPDPLDMMQTEQKKAESVPEPEVEPETKQSLATEPDPAEPAPLTSPFLPDAKVEKRPLGAAQSDSNEPVDDAAEQKRETDPKTVNDPAAQLPADPTEVAAPLPEELQGDLMAVEADTTHEKIKQTHDEAAALAAVRPEAETAPAAVAAPEVTGPTSIPQQYQEEKTVTEVENGTIYDTDHYHQPLAQPAKGKPSWLWIVWVVAVLVLGAAGGAVLFFLKLV